MFEIETPYSQAADDAYEAIRSLNHQTIVGAIPAPHVYSILGNLKFAGGHSLAALLDNMARGLRASVEAFDVYEDDGSDPSVRAYQAAHRLELAAAKAREIGDMLERAKLEISGQGYRVAGDGGPHDPAQIEEEGS